MIFTKTDKKFKTTIGGSALIEGIMMRGPDKLAVVVRGEELITKEKTLNPIGKKYPVLGWPFIRGVVNFADSMKESAAALNFSVEAVPMEESQTKFEKWLEKKFGSKGLMNAVTGIAMVLGVALAVGFFIILPTFLAGLFTEHIAPLGTWRAAFEGGTRLVIFLLYIIAISKMPDMKRVFAYHGAEHKTISCYEAGEELTVENVKKHSRMHPRCGTSFLLMVIIIGILAFLWVSNPNLLVRVSLKLAMLPVVVGISYEINRWLGRNDNAFSRVIRAPGLWMQKFTTREPDDSMIEVGIEAMKLVIPAEAGSDEW